VERLADTLVLLEAGRVLATGPLARLEADPALPLLRAPEAAVTLDATVAAVDEAYALSTLTVAGGDLIVPGRHGPPGSRRRLRISASDVSFTQAPPTGTTILNCLPARIVAISPHDGGDAQVNVAVELGAAEGGARIVARITRKSLDTLGLAPGIIVHAQIKSVALLASGRGSGSA
jgi:molybdate transport system ATP-binding protein